MDQFSGSSVLHDATGCSFLLAILPFSEQRARQIRMQASPGGNPGSLSDGRFAWNPGIAPACERSSSGCSSGGIV